MYNKIKNEIKDNPKLLNLIKKYKKKKDEEINNLTDDVETLNLHIKRLINQSIILNTSRQQNNPVVNNNIITVPVDTHIKFVNEKKLLYDRMISDMNKKVPKKDIKVFFNTYTSLIKKYNKEYHDKVKMLKDERNALKKLIDDYTP